MTEKPALGVRHGGRGLTAASQVTNHRFRQEETCKLERSHTEKGKLKAKSRFFVSHHKMAVKCILLCFSLSGEPTLYCQEAATKDNFTD